MSYFTITTNKETALKIEKVFNSVVMGTHRSLELGDVNHSPGHSVVQIKSSKENGMIEPEDIFWLGHWSNDQK